MQNTQKKGSAFAGAISWLGTGLGRILISLFVPLLTFLVLWRVFLFLRDSEAPQVVVVVVAIIWGVGGVALLFLVSNWLVEQLPRELSRRLQPFVFVGPAVAIIAWYLAVPVVRTLILSFKDAISKEWVGFDNYVFAFTDRIMLETFRNNLLWMVLGTSLSVGIGLLVAVLADRSRFESLYKSIIFMPMAISFVGAGVIWKFVYTYKGEGAGIQLVVGVQHHQHFHRAALQLVGRCAAHHVQEVGGDVIVRVGREHRQPRADAVQVGDDGRHLGDQPFGFAPVGLA